MRMECDYANGGEVREGKEVMYAAREPLECDLSFFLIFSFLDSSFCSEGPKHV